MNLSIAEHKFIDFCKETLGLFDVDVTMETRPVEDLKISSFELMNLFSAIEEEYGIELDLTEVVLVDTVQDLFEMVQDKVGNHDES